MAIEVVKNDDQTELPRHPHYMAGDDCACPAYLVEELLGALQYLAVRHGITDEGVNPEFISYPVMVLLSEATRTNMEHALYVNASWVDDKDFVEAVIVSSMFVPQTIDEQLNDGVEYVVNKSLLTDRVGSVNNEISPGLLGWLNGFHEAYGEVDATASSSTGSITDTIAGDKKHFEDTQSKVDDLIDNIMSGDEDVSDGNEGAVTTSSSTTDDGMSWVGYTVIGLMLGGAGYFGYRYFNNDASEDVVVIDTDSIM